MKAAIVTIGDEILIGQITDTNSGYIAKALDKIGIETHEMISISDSQQHILQTLTLLQNKVQLVIITGGLGPTKDDVTKKTFCEYFNDTLILNESVLDNVTRLIRLALKKELNQANKDQALVPSQAIVLPNRVGTAPGMWMQKEDTIYISLPGVPYEMKYLIDNEIIPQLIAKFERPYILHTTLLTYGQAESIIAERIEDFENNLPSFIKLAYLPSPGRVRLRLTARGTNEQLLKQTMSQQSQILQNLLSDIVVGLSDEEPIEKKVAELLTLKGQTIAIAESFTGGKIAQTFTAIPGASAYFKGSLVSYATQTKIDVLGVSAQTIQQHSVVSPQVATEMATQAQKIFQTDYAIATTGNAGPSKGDSDHEVGTVCIALATPNQVESYTFNFGQPREKVVDRSVAKALELLYKHLTHT